MKSIFLLSGHIVKAIGLIPAILLAFSPLVIYVIYFQKKGTKVTSSPKVLIGFLLIFILCFLISVMFFMTAMSIGAWG